MSYDRAIVSKLSSLALDSKHKIIVGVDYGTTFTGASYVSSRGSGLSDIILISTWPGPSRDTETVFKAPSRIAYADENSRVTTNRWGYQVEPGMLSYSWTKLLLDQGTPLTQYDDSTLETASQTGILKLPKGKVAVDVVADYLSEVYQHILKTISKNITEADLRITPLEFWFTVPAIWSDRALDATRTAAQRAGFGKSSLRPMDQIFLISEPEAAAVTALKKYTTSSMGGSVKAGDGVLVCDCGGGTVDITTYLVLDVFPTLKFEELCTGIGGKCGSTAVDRNFYQLMSDRFGDAFDNLPTKRKSPGSEFMKRFEIIKRDFGNSDEETTFELPLNMTVANPEPEFFDEEERLVLISSADLHSIFDPVIDKIVSLVRQQIADARKETGKDIINRIVLVGGFGDSEYLRKAIRSSFGSTGKITITVPDSPQAAIVQGAALRGLEGLQSTTKRCRRHYGFSWGNRFRAGIDSELNAYYDSYSGKKMVSGIMKWMIAKGTTYTDHYTDTVTVYRTHYEDSTLRKFDTFYACDQEEAPEREEDKAVYTVGDIIVDFSNVNLATFPSKVIKDERVYKLSYELKVTVGAREGVLKFEALSQGQTIGQTSINFSAAKYY
ncbi:heat shock 70 kDa protein 12A [Aspergillus udagawae]|nr:heat shock 70 kDa protein 12A [Aspergillus udagawae]GFG16378.1 heat shock 70 kDa protein 12A [Aspergillus udagawae]GFG27368.1 heat shock 70 kDa protein 12A [Aspergillus udagawae]